jgi:hypothetical protein
VANLFDSTNAISGEPQQIVAGDFIQWKRDDLTTDYPSDSYTLKYSARLHGEGAVEIEITAGSDHLVQISSTTSKNYKPGIYSYQAYIVRNSDSARVVVREGKFEIRPNRDKDGTDPRTSAEINLQKCLDVYEGRIGNDVDSYSISGRSLTKLKPEELRKEINYWQGKVNQERNKAAIKAGKASNATIKARFL